MLPKRSLCSFIDLMSVRCYRYPLEGGHLMKDVKLFNSNPAHFSISEGSFVLVCLNNPHFVGL